MNIRILCCVAGILAVGAMQDKTVPAVDHHQHLYNPALGPLTLGEPVTADDLVKLLDHAGIRRAVLFSIAYQFGKPNRPAIANEYEKVQQENDRVSREMARYPERLRGLLRRQPAQGLCARRDRTLRERPADAVRAQAAFRKLGRAARRPAASRAVREVFRAANDARMAIVAHVRSTISQRRPYGAQQARVLLTEILPSAPDVPIQIAHLAAGGGHDDPLVDEAMSVRAAAAAAHDARVAHFISRCPASPGSACGLSARISSSRASARSALTGSSMDRTAPQGRCDRRGRRGSPSRSCHSAMPRFGPSLETLRRTCGSASPRCLSPGDAALN